MALVLPLDSQKYYLSDTRHYDAAAKNLLTAQGLGEKYYRAPLYPVFLAGVYTIFGASFLAARLVEAILGVLLCYLVYRIASIVFHAEIGLWATALAAIFPHFLVLPAILYPTQLFALLLALSLWLLLQGSDRYKFIILSAIFAALAALTVPAMFFILPFWLVWILAQSKGTFFQRTVHAMVYVSVLALVLLPWSWHLYQQYGRFTLVQPLPNTVLPNLEDPEAQKEEIKSGFKSTVTYLKQNPQGSEKDELRNTFLHYLKHPGATLRHVISELRHFWALYPDRLDTQNDSYRQKISAKDQRMYTGGKSVWMFVKFASILVMAPLFILGLIGLTAQRPDCYQWLLLITILFFSLGYAMIYAEVRYRIPIEPYILMFAAAGIHRAITSWRCRPQHHSEASCHGTHLT